MGVFRFLDLPLELRELVYYFSIGPLPIIEPAAIPDTPSRIQMPVIAQLSRETRKEALDVYYRKREVHISLHCQRNISRTLTWLASLKQTVEFSGLVVISGLGKYLSAGDTFYMAISCSNKEPQFRVEARQGASSQTDVVCQKMRAEIDSFFEERASLKTEIGKLGKMTASELGTVVGLVRAHAGPVI